MIKFTAKDDGTSNGTSHTLRSGMRGNFHVPFWREVGKGNSPYSPNPTTEWEEVKANEFSSLDAHVEPRTKLLFCQQIPKVIPNSEFGHFLRDIVSLKLNF